MEAAVRWSPHANGDRQRFLVVDVAEGSLTLNQLDNSRTRTRPEYHRITRHGKISSLTAFAWSPIHEPLVAIGHGSGDAALVRLREDKQASEIVAQFRTKQQRKCNSIALSSDNVLAVALDKTRSDVCLKLYSLSTSPSNSPEPTRRLCAAELVSSVRFFPSTPQEIIATTQRSFLKIFDLREAYLGAGSSTPSLQATTRHVNNIAIDPLDENYFATSGSTGDPSVTVWDKRWLSSAATGSNSGAVFSFSPAVDISAPTTVWSSRYSGLKRGRLAVCSSTGELRVIDMVEGQGSALQSSEYLPSNPFGGSPWLINRYVNRSRVLEAPWSDERRGRRVEDRAIAFDWSNIIGEGTSQSMVVLRPSREVEIVPVREFGAAAQITSRQDIAVHFNDIIIREADSTAGSDSMLNAHSSAEDFGAFGLITENQTDGFAFGAQLLGVSIESPHLTRLLTAGCEQRQRCIQGYLFDCGLNSKIVAGNFQLERLWEIVKRFREQAAEDGMVYEAIDLSYVGVAGLWSETIGNTARRTLLPSRPSIAETIVGLNMHRELPDFVGEQTSFPEHRQLCLALCGWKFTTDTLEEECQQLIDRGQPYLAIVQAVLHDYKHIALNLLRTLIRSKTIPNIGLGALLAADTLNEEQRDMCLWMAADTEDTALKALLTYLSTGNWRDVMKTSYLHLGYRMALGCKYLNDTELSGFLQTETARAIRNGDLEGILLTGLGEQGMDLFQTYIAKTNDLQTAVLATAFTNPKYVDDMRWDMWKEVYLDQLQSWQTFNERAKFVVQHNRLAQSRDGRSMIEPPTSQLTIICTHCRTPFGGQKPEMRPDRQTLGTRIDGPAAHAGTVCKSCGRHLPRCAICALWLGTPDPGTRAGARELAKQEDRLAKLLCFCVSCSHGYHADHAKAWFDKYDICAVPDCSCNCGLKGA